MGKLKRRLFGLDVDEVGFDRRGFRGGHVPGIRDHIEAIGRTFLHGYHAALAEDEDPALFAELDTTPCAYRGFAYEGAAMSLFLLDRLSLWPRQRFERFIEQAGGDHIYMAMVGAGWAMARLPFGLSGLPFGFKRSFARLDPVLRWLAFDGYGFHQGFFHWQTSIIGPQEVPRRVRGYARKVFDQGLGRSLWFVDGADVERIPRTVATFSPERRADLWAGLGLAAGYAAGVPRDHLAAFFASAGPYRVQVAQGAAFAAKARLRAGNLTSANEDAAQILCGSSAEEAARLTDLAKQDLPDDVPGMPAYEVWRQRIQKRLVSGPGGIDRPSTPHGYQRRTYWAKAMDLSTKAAS